MGAFPFVGRASENAELDRARAGGGLVLVTGEAGIGKTTLASAFAKRAEEAGARVAYARAWEGAGAPAFWIWREAFRSIGETLPVPKTLAGDEARFACLEEIAERVRALPAGAVIVLDDLQWADAASLLALKLIARGMRKLPVLVVATLREPHEVDLEDIRREATVMKLGGLPLEAIAELAAVRGVFSEGAEVALRLSGGNALFAREMLDDEKARAALREGRDPPIPRAFARCWRVTSIVCPPRRGARWSGPRWRAIRRWSRPPAGARPRRWKGTSIWRASRGSSPAITSRTISFAPLPTTRSPPSSEQRST